MAPTPLEVGEWLEKGLGRAMLAVREHGGRPYRDAILYACLHNQTYDTQIDPSRAPYLMEILRESGEARWYRDAIVSGLASVEDEDDLMQLLHLARLFAEQGDAGARQAMYDAVAGWAAAHREYDGAEHLVALDGLEGFLFAARLLLKHGPPRFAPPTGTWVRTLEEREGKEEAWRLLEAAELREPALHPILEQVREWDRPAHRWPWPPTVEPYDSFRKKLGRWIGPGLGGHWGKWAPPSERRRAAKDLLLEQDTIRLRNLLAVFRARPFPLDPARLIELAQHPDERIPHMATLALARLRWRSVRALALELAGDPDHCDDAVDLLTINYQPGDHALVAQLLEKPMDRDATHGLVLAAVDFAEKHLHPPAEPVLLLAYEKSPCLSCRHRAVELLLKLGRLPAWMREECRWDADPDIRGAVTREA